MNHLQDLLSSDILENQHNFCYSSLSPPTVHQGEGLLKRITGKTEQPLKLKANSYNTLDVHLNNFKDTIICNSIVQKFCYVTAQNTFNLNMWNMSLTNSFAIVPCVTLDVLGRKGVAFSCYSFLVIVTNYFLKLDLFKYCDLFPAWEGLNEHNRFSKIYTLSRPSLPSTLILKI